MPGRGRYQRPRADRGAEGGAAPGRQRPCQAHL